MEYPLLTISHPSLAVLQKGEKAPLIVCLGSLDRTTADNVAQAVEWVGSTERVTLLLSSRGGHVMAAFKIALMLRQCCATLRVLVPRRARSSATLLALAADTLQLGYTGELGPLDASIIVGPLHCGEVVRFAARDLPYLQRIEREWFDVSPRGLVATFSDNFAAVATLVGLYRAEQTVADLAQELLRRRLYPPTAEQSAALVQHLLGGYPSHDYPIMRAEAVAIGLPVDAPCVERERLSHCALRECETLAPGVEVGGAEVPSLVVAGTQSGQWRMWPPEAETLTCCS